MIILRGLAWVFLLIATIALVNDITRSSFSGSVTLTSTLVHWKSFFPQSLAAFITFVQKSVHPLVWDPLVVRVLILPAWITFGALGIVCGLLGRKKRRINIFAN
jgi:hypothetical protein